MKTVLVIEDKPVNAKLIREILEASGYEVVVAEDAIRGLKLAASLRPWVVLMDLRLPGMDGLSATRRLKDAAETRAIPVIAVTAHAMPGDEEEARRAGCLGYLTKPLRYRQLLDAVAARGN